MMSALVPLQSDEGRWYNVLDLPDDSRNWLETSGSAMFTFAMATGLNRGWLPEDSYLDVVAKAWSAIARQVRLDGEVDGVCQGTNHSFSLDFYFNRQRGLNHHGPLAVLWAASEVFHLFPETPWGARMVSNTGELALEWDGRGELSYQVAASDDLTLFEALGPMQSGIDGPRRVGDIAGPGSRFFRVRSFDTPLAPSSGIPMAGVRASGDDRSSSSSVDYNTSSNTLDGDLGTRWSSDGIGEWIRFDLGLVYPVDGARLAFFDGDLRIATFDIEVSLDGEIFTPVLTDAASSGTTNELETYSFPATAARYVRVVGKGNSENTFTSITEARVLRLGPQVDILSPANGATEVAADADLIVTFSEAVVAVAGGEIRIYDAADPSTPVETILAQDVTVNGAVVTIDPVGDFTLGGSYFIEIDTGAFEDLSGNPFPGIWGPGTLAFTVQSVVPVRSLIGFQAEGGNSDTTPVVATIGGEYNSNSDGLALEGGYLVTTTATSNTGYPNSDSRTVSYQIDFPEAGTYDVYARVYVDGGDTNDSFFYASDLGDADPVVNGDWYTVNDLANDNGPLRINANEYVWVNLTEFSWSENASPLVVSTAGTVTWEVGAREPGFRIDAFAFGTTGDFFTDAELTAATLNTSGGTGPAIDSLSPANGTLNVAVDSNLVITFDTDVALGSAGSVTILDASGDSVIEAIDVTSGNVTVTASNEVTINPVGDLPAGTNCYVRIDPGAIEDTTGSDFAGILNSSTWAFSTTGSASINLVYSQSFDYLVASGNGPIGATGWQSNRGTNGTADSTLNTDSQQGIVIGSLDGGGGWDGPGTPTTQGYLFADGALGTDRQIYWIEQSVGDISEIAFFEFDLRNNTQSEGLRLALRIGSDWYVARPGSATETSQNSTTWDNNIQVNPFTGIAEWAQLSFVPGGGPVISGYDPLEPLSTTVSLPTSGTVTAFGFYNTTTNANARIDNFEVYSTVGE